MYENVILLVEDSAPDIELLQASFEQWRVTNPVQVVRDGVAAKDYLAGEGQFTDRTRYPFPSLVLLDLLIPRVTGLALLQWIRSRPDTASLPVVVLTGSRNLNDFELAYRLGANACVAKSLDLAELQELVHHLDYFSLASDLHASEVDWFPEN